MIDINKLYNKDNLELMKELESDSIQLIYSDIFCLLFQTETIKSVDIFFEKRQTINIACIRLSQEGYYWKFYQIT